MKKSFIPALFAAILSLTTISAIHAAPAVAGNPAIVPAEQGGGYARKHFQQMIALPNRDKVPLVFLGDSITDCWSWPTARRGLKVWNEVWAPMHAADFGANGATTQNLLWNIDHGLFNGMHPKLVVLMIGTNNTARHMLPDQTAAGVKAIIDRIKTQMPQTKVLLLAIFPRGATPADPMRVLNEKVNGIIQNYADNQTVFYLDIGKAFLQPDGTLSKTLFPDLLHPNETGYGIWAKEILPEVQKLMAD